MAKAEIHYLYHDGFIAETKSHILIFDYYNDKSTGDRIIESGVISQEILKSGKDIYVFVTHSHGDHFNPVIFNWINVNDKIKYILSSDIKPLDTYPKCHIISEGEVIRFDDIYIKAFGSTDIGISFLVQTDGLNIFHAGDLNLWHWKDESDEYNKQMADDFKSKLSRLMGTEIDIAFFPVDPRLEEYYYLGGEYFIKNLSPRLFIPMHFGDKPEITQKFAVKEKGLNSKIAVIKNRGEKIIY